MSEPSFNDFFKQPFGRNIMPGERTRKQFGQTASNLAGGGVLKLAANYLEKYEYVFNGDLKKDSSKVCLERLRLEDALREKGKPRFDNKF